MPADKDNVDEAKNKKIGQIIVAVAIAAVVGINAYFWIRWNTQAAVTGVLVDHQCKLSSNSFKHHLFTRADWSIPIFGPSWTDVPCSTHLEVKEGTSWKSIGDVDASFAHDDYTRTTFDVPQHTLGPDLSNSWCHVQVPKYFGMKDGFDCCFAPGNPKGVGVYAKHVAERPDLANLLLMKACGMSFCTLSPFLFCLICAIKGKMSGQADARTATVAPEGAYIRI